MNTNTIQFISPFGLLPGEFNRGEGYWYYNKTLYLLENTHINFVKSNPELFGLSEEYIDSVYQEMNEPLGFEGKARIKIMTKLIIEKGWIRIRHHYGKGSYFWTFECNHIDDRIDDVTLIGTWMLEHHRLSLYDEIHINSLATHKDIILPITADIIAEPETIKRSML